MFELKYNNRKIALFISITLSTLIVNAVCCSRRILYVIDTNKDYKTNSISINYSDININDNNDDNNNNNNKLITKLDHHNHHHHHLHHNDHHKNGCDFYDNNQRLEFEYSSNNNIELNKMIEIIMSTECSPLFNLYYCLNGGRCFNYTIENFTSPSCECLEGYFGERCETKYVIIKSDFYNHNISMAQIYFGPFVAALLGTIAIYVSYTIFCQKRKKFVF